MVEVGHFWGYQIDDRNSNVLGCLATEINKQELMPLSTKAYPNLICLAPFTNYGNVEYYRAQILYISGKEAVVCSRQIILNAVVCVNVIQQNNKTF